MKKKILLLLILFGGILGAQADNTVSVSSALVAQGKTGSFNIELTNTDVFLAFQMNLTLPEGITFVSATKGNRYAENHSLGVATHGQTITFTMNSSTNAEITGNSGALLTVTVAADADLEVGEKLDAALSNMELIQKVGETGRLQVHPDPIDFKVEITDRVILDENSTVPPTPQSGVNVLVKRTIKVGQWSTLVLPFTLSKTNVTSIFGSAQFAEFDSFETDYGDDETNMTPLGITINLKSYTIPRAGITGGKPLLVKLSDDASDIESFTVDNVNINVSSVTDAVKEDAVNGLTGKLTGSFVKTTIPADGLFISDNKFWYSAGKTNVKAFRCWFELGAVLGQETDFGARIKLNFDDTGANGVQGVDAAQQQAGQLFDLQGRRVETPARGLYIRDGKKIVVK